MNSQPTPTALVVRITSILPLAEKIFLAGLAIGVILTLTNIDSMVLKVSLAALAVIFFLSAYKVIDIPRQGNEILGFKELLAYTIVPKIMWISCAVSTVGILLSMLNSGNEGYKQMLFIGGTSLAIGVLILFYFIITGLEHIVIIVPVLYRAIPLLVLDLYLLFK